MQATPKVCILLPLAPIRTAPNALIRGAIAVSSSPRRASRDVASLHRALAVFWRWAGAILGQHDAGGTSWLAACQCQRRREGGSRRDGASASWGRQVVGDVGNILTIWAGHGDGIGGRFNAEKLNSGCCTPESSRTTERPHRRSGSSCCSPSPRKYDSGGIGAALATQCFHTHGGRPRGRMSS